MNKKRMKFPTRAVVNPVTPTGKSIDSVYTRKSVYRNFPFGHEFEYYYRQSYAGWAGAGATTLLYQEQVPPGRVLDITGVVFRVLSPGGAFAGDVVFARDDGVINLLNFRVLRNDEDITDYNVQAFTLFPVTPGGNFRVLNTNIATPGIPFHLTFLENTTLRIESLTNPNMVGLIPYTNIGVELWGSWFEINAWRQLQRDLS